MRRTSHTIIGLEAKASHMPGVAAQFTLRSGQVQAQERPPWRRGGDLSGTVGAKVEAKTI